MAMTITPTEFALLREYIEKQCGIRVGDDKTYLIESRLGPLVIEAGCSSFTLFYQKAIADGSRYLRDQIVDAMTTNETLWFRDRYPYISLREKLLPQFAAEIKAGKRKSVRIWSAASSTGQEPYSIAMTVQDFCRGQTVLTPSQVSIVATDISPTVLFLAKSGKYDSLSIARGLPLETRERYFTCEGRMWQLADAIRSMVDFKKINLQESYTALGSFDVIFCRNVLIYFSDDFKKDVIRRLATALNPQGYLLVGSSESVSNYSLAFAMIHELNSIYYQLK